MSTEKIVVGIDGSPGSDAALAWAIDEAGAGAEIVAVHVVGSIVPPTGVTTAAAPPVHDPCSSHLRRIAIEACFERLTASGVAHRMLTVRGHPATQILRVADDEEADLIVVGNGLHSTMDELFLGSVAHELTHHARRPLVIVPARQATRIADALGRTYPAARSDALAAR